jgi:hypothetical protein
MFRNTAGRNNLFGGKYKPNTSKPTKYPQTTQMYHQEE